MKRILQADAMKEILKLYIQEIGSKKSVMFFRENIRKYSYFLV